MVENVFLSLKNMYNLVVYFVAVIITIFVCRLRHLLGYTRDDFIGKTPFDFQHHDDLEATMECSRQGETKDVY